MTVSRTTNGTTLAFPYLHQDSALSFPLGHNNPACFWGEVQVIRYPASGFDSFSILPLPPTVAVYYDDAHSHAHSEISVEMKNTATLATLAAGLSQVAATVSPGPLGLYRGR